MSESHSHATATGLAPNVAGALAYLLGPVTGIALLVLEPENRFVRFHAAQSVALGVAYVVAAVALSIVGGILRFVPFLGWAVGSLLSLGFSLGALALWVTLIWRALQGAEWEVPALGRYSRQVLGRTH